MKVTGTIRRVDDEELVELWLSILREELRLAATSSPAGSPRSEQLETDSRGNAADYAAADLSVTFGGQAAPGDIEHVLRWGECTACGADLKADGSCEDKEDHDS